ncbi:MAG: hypothetical protein HY289_11505 [Planctomycetes bacterium]|nr:hypothetical protein [Planctomycetota bacterium]
MRIAGEWRLCDDGVVRPVLLVRVDGPSGVRFDETFLVDPGADRTVFSEALLVKLGGATAPAPSGVSLGGIGGSQAFVQVQATLSFQTTDGSPATVQGQFAAFTDPLATDFSILGRDVMDHFDVILSRRRNELCLLAPPSRYDIHP